MKKGFLTAAVPGALVAVALLVTGSASAGSREVLVRLPTGDVVTASVSADPCTPASELPLPAGLPAGSQVVGASGGADCAPAVPDPPTGSGGEAQPPTKAGERIRKKAARERGRRKSRARGEGRRRSGPTGGVRPRTGPKLRGRGGVPTPQNPTYFDAQPGPADLKAVPNFTIRHFRIPLFLLPIYQAAGIQYGIRWEVLASINEIETNYGRNLNVSSAGAVGWMQFLPSTWRRYGVDGNRDKRKDPYNPVDAIFAAARYLKAAGGDKNLKKAIFAYNHADWYVDAVMLRARVIAGMPPDLTSSLTGLTEARFPVYARARYADDLSEREARRRLKPGQNAAKPVEGTSRRGIEIFSRPGAPVIAVNDSVVKQIGRSRQHGRYIVLQDVYGNRFYYKGLGKLSRLYPVPKADVRDPALDEAASPGDDPRPASPASAGRQVERERASQRGRRPGAARRAPTPRPTVPYKDRLFANPDRPRAKAAGGIDQILSATSRLDGFTTFRNYFSRAFGLNAKDVRLKRLRRGSRVIGGTIIGRVGRPDPTKASHLKFEIRPAGRGAPRIDPKPILDGWKLLEATAIYRASGRNALRGNGISIGQILLLPKALLERRVLADERIEIHACGRKDIRAGQIDRRVLATLAYLAESGFRPTVTSLRCGRESSRTSSGSVSYHASGNAVDIAKINGVSVLGHQERGGIVYQVVRRLLLLQGTMEADEIITLLDLGGPSFAMGDHADHIHVGFRPLFGSNRKLGKQAMAILKPGQWNDLIGRLGRIENPVVPRKPSRFATPVRSRRGRGD
ncbi:MAG: lytic murein transglycosylase [Actinomycetota bacterium]|nr:lytic murein transglycosylase [Actinomycetota bacterium]